MQSSISPSFGGGEVERGGFTGILNSTGFTV